MRRGGPSAERGQHHQVTLRHNFKRKSGFAPGGEAADHHVRVKSFFPQYVRHTGAGGFAHSSAVEVDLLVARQIVEHIAQAVGLDADGAADA